MMEKKNTRDRILEVATYLFQTKGYHATGLNEILRESKAPKGSLYYYFPDGKEQLALESINLTKEFVEETIKERLEKIQDPAESIKKSIEEMADTFHIQDSKKSIRSNKKVSINLIALETAETNENLRSACESSFDSWQKLYVNKLIDSGFARERAEKLGLVIQSMVEGAITMALTKKSDEPLLEIAKQIPIIINQ